MPRLKFTAHEATIHKAIVVALDLEDFSFFCNYPDQTVAATVPKLIKRVFDLLNESLDKLPKKERSFPTIIYDEEAENPRLIKFTGDGALMVWIWGQKEEIPQEFCDQVVRMMREFQQRLFQELPAWEKEWRVHGLPRCVRVGIASGSVFALRPPHSFTSMTEPFDYVGYCINLAVRLQSHCGELGFLVHQSLHPNLDGMVALTAKGMKGARHEPVLAFETDLENVTTTVLKRKFAKPD